MGLSSHVGEFCSQTTDALQAFQRARGLRVSEFCDEHCWKALVEASWKLGDRMLLLTSPNLRGDDVTELQSRLTRLGFDCGRVDGILGPNTATALSEFQANCGLPADGVCGHDTVRALDRVIGQTGTGPGITAVRERETLRHSPTMLANLRIVVGQFGGLSTISRSISRELRSAGAQVMSLDEPDAVAQALAANHYQAHLYVGLEGRLDLTSTVHFYQVATYESVGGRTLATCLTAELEAIGVPMAPPVGMRLPVLRETRMPAVLVSVSPVRTAVDAALEVGTAAMRAVEAWMRVCTLSA
ncbi:MAG: putative cell wall hydrolase [Ilumatobacteraceae bacterium]|nr:putative cell wall hydrolase [Ilumatobacteraceae bacterium]